MMNNWYEIGVITTACIILIPLTLFIIYKILLTAKDYTMGRDLPKRHPDNPFETSPLDAAFFCGSCAFCMMSILAAMAWPLIVAAIPFMIVWGILTYFRNKNRPVYLATKEISGGRQDLA